MKTKIQLMKARDDNLSNIEIQGLSRLQEYISSSSILEPNFKSNDKTPSWDGEIFVYANKTKNKSLLKRIPVQIKSTQVKTLNNETCKFSMEVVDLKNYFVDGGILVFVIEVLNANDKRIFYKSLLPNDIKTLLDNTTNNQKKKTICLYALDYNQIHDFEIICFDFIKHRELQYSTKSLKLNLSDAKEFMITGHLDGMSFEEYLHNNEHYIYARSDINSSYICVAKTSLNIIKQMNRKIGIGSKVYYDNYNAITEKESSYLEFGDGIRFEIQKGKIHIKYTGNLKQLLTNIEFLLETYENKEFYIGEVIIKSGCPESEINNLIKLKKYYKYLNDIQTVLSIFKIDSKYLNVDELDKISQSNLFMLIDIMVYNKKVKSIPYEMGSRSIKVGNLFLAVYIYRNDNSENVYIVNYFGEFVDRLKLVIDSQEGKKIGKEVEASPYIILKDEHLISISNLDLIFIHKSIISVKYTNEYSDAVVNFELELIKAFDLSKDIKFLNCARAINDWLINNDSTNTIYKVNFYQIIRREREFNSNEKDELLKLRLKRYTKKQKREAILCSINILLENKTDAECLYNKFSDLEKDKYNKYPIFNLAKSLGIFIN